MKNLSLLLLAGVLVLPPVRVSGMIPRGGGAEKGKDEEHGDKKPDPTKATEERSDKEQIATAQKAALQGPVNSDLENNREVVEKEITVTREENVDFQLNPLEQSAWDRLQPAAEAASAAFNELVALPRDSEGNILNPSKQEELRPRILQALKAYEDQRQAWIAQATSQRLADVEALEKATKPITFEIVKDLDVSTEENGAVFWTGYDKENQRTIMACAAEQGKKTIEMTRDGKLLNQLGMYKEDSPIATPIINEKGDFVFDEKGEKKCESKLGNLLFDAVSTKFAQAALWKMVQEHANKEEEQKLQQESSVTRLKAAQELVKTEEQQELADLKKLHNQTTTGWEAVEKRMQELLKKNKQIAKAEKAKQEMTSPFEAFHQAKEEPEKATIEANKTLFEAIDKQEPSSWELAQEAAQMITDGWKQAAEETPDHWLVPIAERIKLKRDLPKIQKQQNLWSKKENYAAKKQSALKTHQQIKTGGDDLALIDFVTETWNELLQHHQELLSEHAKEMTNTERQAWEKEKEHLLNAKEEIQLLKEKTAEEKLEKPIQEKKEEPLQQKTETLLTAFQQLLSDASSLSRYSHTSKWKEYQKKYEHFFEEVERLAIEKQAYYQNQSQKREAAQLTAQLLSTWQQTAALAKEEQEKHEKLNKIPISYQEEALFKIPLSMLWTQLQESLELEKGDSPIAALWKESRELYEQAVTAWNQNKKEEAKLLENRAQCLGGCEKNPGAAYASQQARRTLAQGKLDAAVLWKESAIQHQLSSDYYRQQAEAIIQGDSEKAERFEVAVWVAKESGSRLNSADNAQEKALKAEAERKLEVATFWKESAKQHQLFADYYRQKAEAIVQGNSEKEECFEAVTKAVEWSAWSLDSAAKAQEEAIKAQAEGKLDVATFWKESAKQHQLAADYLRQSAEAIVQGNSEKEKRFQTVAVAVEKEAEAAEEKAKEWK